MLIAINKQMEDIRTNLIQTIKIITKVINQIMLHLLIKISKKFKVMKTNKKAMIIKIHKKNYN